jgi:hypothetical protein
MMWDLPLSVEIDGEQHAIRNKCDYRVILDVISALNDEELEMENRVQCALIIFYEDVSKIKNVKEAIEGMFRVINLGEENDGKQEEKPRVMDWEQDFNYISPPVSRVLGYSVRDANRHTHWFDFVGAYMEIGECTFANVVSIRNKKMRGKKLEKWEEEFYRENRKIVDLKMKLTTDEEEFLNSEW